MCKVTEQKKLAKLAKQKQVRLTKKHQANYYLAEKQLSDQMLEDSKDYIAIGQLSNIPAMEMMRIASIMEPKMIEFKSKYTKLMVGATADGLEIAMFDSTLEQIMGKPSSWR